MVIIYLTDHCFNRWKGIRDDLEFLMEDLSSVSLCALHMEMQNTEQLIGSLGLFAYKCGSLRAQCQTFFPWSSKFQTRFC